LALSKRWRHFFVRRLTLPSVLRRRSLHRSTPGKEDTMKRRLFSTVLALTALSACAEIPAQPFAPPLPSSRIGSLMQISIVDRASGAELPIYRHRGEYWVAGRPGARYAIRARNAMGERIMAVMSVDGVNVVTGETAGIGQNGYVFSGRERSDITGWRKSDSQIAAFEFASAGNSYASRTGRPDDVGVIGVAMFRENVPVPPAPPITPYPRRDEYGGERERRSESSAAWRASKRPARAWARRTAAARPRTWARPPSSARSRRRTRWSASATTAARTSSPRA
jgi:hypothetical protein